MSPQWVLRSATQGSLQRVSAMSLDVSRRLPADETAQLRHGAGQVTADAAQIAGQAVKSCGFSQSRAAREAMLAKLIKRTVRSPSVSCWRPCITQEMLLVMCLKDIPAGVTHEAGRLLLQPEGARTVLTRTSSAREAPTPGCLLEDLLWSVTEPIDAARLDRRCTAGAAGPASQRCELSLFSGRSGQMTRLQTTPGPSGS